MSASSRHYMLHGRSVEMDLSHSVSVDSHSAGHLYSHYYGSGRVSGFPDRKSQQMIATFLVVILVVLSCGVEGSKILNMTARGYQECTDTQTPVLQCINQGFYTRFNIETQIEFSNFTDTLRTINWSVVNADGSAVSSTTDFIDCPQGKTCVPTIANTTIQLLILRPRIASRLEFIGYTPLGYVLLNYTSNDTQYPVNASWYNASATCGGKANAGFTPPYASCSSMPPDFLNYDYIDASGLCGSDAYQPMINSALDPANMASQNNGAGAYTQCLYGAACYPCANSTDPLQQNNTIMYATLAFGQCSVFRVSSVTQMFADLFINVTINGTVSQLMYVGGMYGDSLQNTMKLSKISPTMRASILLTVPDGIASQTADYIITCDGSNPNSTQTPGVMGPFNLAFNTPGYVPDPQWSNEIYPFPFSNQTMNGGWIAVSTSDMETSFAQTTQDPFPCGKSQIDPTAFGPTYAFYSSQSMVDEACAVDEFLGANSTNSSLRQGRCVPGYWPEYGLTVCQRFARMRNYSQTFIDAGYPSNYPPSPDLPQGNNIRNFQFFLFQYDDDEDNDVTDTDGTGTLFLMQTAPSITDSIMMKGSITLDISTDSVPYFSEGVIQVVIETPPSPGVLCRFDRNVSRGYLQQTVCQLTDNFPSTVQLTVYDCTNGIVFLANESDVGWSFSNDTLSATFDPYVAVDQDTACFTTSFLVFDVPNVNVIAGTSNYFLLPGSCKLKVVATVEEDSQPTSFQTFGSATCAVGIINPTRIQNAPPVDNSLTVWQMLLIVFMGGFVLLLLVGCLVGCIIYCNRNDVQKSVDNSVNEMLLVHSTE